MNIYIPIGHINMLHRLPGPDEAVRAACEAATEAQVTAMADHLRWIRSASDVRYAARLDYVYQHGHRSSWLACARAELETDPAPSAAVLNFIKYATESNAWHDTRCFGRRGPWEDAREDGVVSSPRSPWIDVDGALRAAGVVR